MNDVVFFLNLGILVLLVLLILLQIRLARKVNSRPILEHLLQLDNRLAGIEKAQESLTASLRSEVSVLRSESSTNARNAREEANSNLVSFQNSMLSRMAEIAGLQKNQLDTFSQQLGTLTQTTESRMEAVRQTVEDKLRTLQEDNSQKLEQMRATVDEKLHATLEQRLGESFKLVSDRLEMVHQGLGEMQTLATGVGDLKKVLTNVKTRGIWGEIQLAAILEEILTSEQFAVNVITRPASNERVDFAVKLPGKQAEEECVWLPIDAKFPQEDYLRLVDACEQGNPALAEEAGKQLENRIKLEAKSIRDKYVNPPHTTDFGIMFLPTESLYAEVVKRPDLLNLLQRDYRVIVTGPSTMAALLNSLSIGFRTLAIEKRSSEVWSLLGAVKNEFGKFGEVLEKTRKKLDEASNSLETASRKSRTIERRLKQVQEIPSDSQAGLGLENLEDEEGFNIPYQTV